MLLCLFATLIICYGTYAILLHYSVIVAVMDAALTHSPVLVLFRSEATIFGCCWMEDCDYWGCDRRLPIAGLLISCFIEPSNDMDILLHDAPLKKWRVVVRAAKGGWLPPRQPILFLPLLNRSPSGSLAGMPGCRDKAIYD